MQHFQQKWREITQDSTVLEYITGYRLRFSRKVLQRSVPTVRFPSENERNNVRLAIQELLHKGAIEPAVPDKDQFLSSYFLIPKPQGSSRFILNLKNLNEFMAYVHFKMEDIRTAQRLVSHDTFLANIDLQDAYLLIPIHTQSRKYLRFQFENTLYQFTCMPFGLCSGPRVFTKLMRPVIQVLRKQGKKSVIYLDDILCVAGSYENCRNNVRLTISLLESLGFIINYKKSKLIPSMRCRFLGFIIDTQNFVLELPDAKRRSLTKLLASFCKKSSCRISEFAHLIGKLVAASPAVDYGALYIKQLERVKIEALVLCGGNYEGKMQVPRLISPDLNWWRASLRSAHSIIRRDIFDLTIFSDASNSGWGATDGFKDIYGFWSDEEKAFHINYKELLAVKFALHGLAADTVDSQILLRVDNTTAIAYVNKMGSVRFPKFHGLTRDIWQWAERRRNFLVAAYIPSAENREADHLSRISNEDTEWEIADWAFVKIIERFGKPDIDLFATQENRKCDQFCSRFPTPAAWAIDAFTINWATLNFYAFPPFAIILKVLAKIRRDRATGIVVVPNWSGQPWFPLFRELLTSRPLIFRPHNSLLISRCREKTHPQAHHISLLAGRISAKLS